MKVVFVNAPVIRSASSSPENGFALDGIPLSGKLQSVPLVGRLIRKSRLGGTIRYGVRAGSRWPWTMDRPHGGPPYPFIMGYAASYLREAGIEVTILDAVAEEEYSYERFLQRVRAENPDIVVVECSTPTIDIDIWIAEKIADTAEVCLAGPHLTFNATEIAARHPKITYLLKGEYILSSLDMARTRRPGIYESKVVDDLDALPFPFRDYAAATRYYDPTMPTARPQLQVYASKGCPFQCTFCMWPQTMYQGKVTLRKPELVAAEIRECVQRYGYRSIFFDDDTFNIGTDRISELCDHLREIGLPWTMMGRLDCSPTWLYDKMVACGCVGMRFGIETFDVAVLERIKKGLQSDNMIQTLRHISEAHPAVMIHVTMMKDLPGQTEAIHRRDMQILQDLGYSPDNMQRSYQLSTCAPFPGTRMYEELAAELGEEAASDFRRYDGGTDTVMKKLRKTEEP